MPTTFVDRLQRVIDDRKPYTWAESMGWNKGTTARVMQGHIPGSELLVPLSWIENVRLDWLITGRGRPYFGEVFAEDATAAMALEYTLEAEEWEIHVITCRGRFAVVLTQPAEVDVKGKSISFTAMEVFLGNLGPKVREALLPYLPASQPRSVDIDEDTWYQLQLGELGAYQLLHREDAPLQREALSLMVNDTDLANIQYAAEGGGEATVVFVNDDVRHVVSTYKELPEGDRNMVSGLMDRLLQTARKIGTSRPEDTET